MEARASWMYTRSTVRPSRRATPHRRYSIIPSADGSTWRSCFWSVGLIGPCAATVRPTSPYARAPERPVQAPILLAERGPPMRLEVTPLYPGPADLHLLLVIIAKVGTALDRILSWSSLLFEPSRNRILHKGSNGIPGQDRSRTTGSRLASPRTRGGARSVSEPSRKNCTNLRDNYRPCSQEGTPINLIPVLAHQF